MKITFLFPNETQQEVHMYFPKEMSIFEKKELIKQSLPQESDGFFTKSNRHQITYVGRFINLEGLIRQKEKLEEHEGYYLIMEQLEGSKTFIGVCLTRLDRLVLLREGDDWIEE